MRHLLVPAHRLHEIGALLLDLVVVSTGWLQRVDDALDGRGRRGSRRRSGKSGRSRRGRRDRGRVGNVSLDTGGVTRTMLSLMALLAFSGLLVTPAPVTQLPLDVPYVLACPLHEHAPFSFTVSLYSKWNTTAPDLMSRQVFGLSVS